MSAAASEATSSSFVGQPVAPSGGAGVFDIVAASGRERETVLTVISQFQRILSPLIGPL